MAKVQGKNAVEEQDDGLREKMIAVNRVSKTVKGGHGQVPRSAAVRHEGYGTRPSHDEARPAHERHAASRC